MRRCVLVMMMVMVGLMSHGIEVKVNLFTGQTLKDITIRHHTGRYLLYGDGLEITSLSHGEGVTFTVEDTAIIARDHGIVIGIARSFLLSGTGMQNIFAMDAASMPTRFYDDHVMLHLAQGAIRIINQVDLEKYVAGVIQAEAGGSTSNVEYFKVQAMVSRTYALRLLALNGKDFCLTDDVNNQVYKGRPTKPQILEAVALTTGAVILYDDTNLINAVFHSNSGGQTLAANDVWISSLPYLQPVADTFAAGQRNFTWKHTMPIVEWLDYLDKTWGFPVQNDSMKILAMSYTQLQREKYFPYNIPLTKVRSDLRLKSTFFSISIDRDQVVFEGKGYGHGVGLSQEGAIRMADLGFSAPDILKHYYTGVTIRPLSELQITASLM
jgi:stage II sporulation protein D